MPTFVIVGAQRSGTTSLYRYLHGHPDVTGVRFGKGVHWFDTGYGRSFDWYRAHFPLDGRKVPGASRHAHVGEGSPYYMFHPLAMTRIVERLPDIRVIAVLRDPVVRAHSQWAHEVARGYEHLDFRAAIAAEEERLAGEEQRLRDDPLATSHAHQHQSYVSRGQYAPQIERIRALVPEEHVLVLPFHELASQPQETFDRVLSFLGLAPYAPAFEKHNPRSYPKMDADLRESLIERFRPSDERLVELLGPSFVWPR